MGIKMSLYKRIICILFFSIVWLPALCLATEIQLKSNAEVQGDRVTLGEISNISPKSEEAILLAAVELFPAPSPGMEKTVTSSSIKNTISRKSEASASINWNGAENIKVKRASIHIGPQEIRSLLEDYIDRNRDFLPPADIRFKEISLVKPFDLPAGTLDVEIIPADSSIVHSRRFTLIFRVNDSVEKNLAIRVELEAYLPVAIAAKNLRRGDVIQKEDIRLAQMDIISIPNPCFNPDELIGKKIMHSIRQGSPLDQERFEWPPIIHRGELVTIYIRKGALFITAKGTAKHDAQKGEPVTVVNTTSSKEIICRADSPGLVQAEL
jgi:flagella basal body P-ring formation protein FlgA